MRSLFLITLGCLLLSGVSVSCQNSTPPEQQTGTGKQKITLALNWLPEGEHGGFYAALLNGDYAAEGLDVEILPGGPDSPVIQRVGAQRVTFGISNADRIALGQAQQANVVGLLAPLQHSPRCIMVHAESGFESLTELRDITLAMSDAPAFSLFLKKNLELPGVRIVRYTGSIGQFLREPNYAQQGYVFSEPIIARREGANPRALLVSELGFDPYSSVLITNGELIETQPELVKKFVQASWKGWQSYLADPHAVHEYIHQLNPEMTVAVLDEGHVELKKLALDNDGQFTGQMNATRWQTLVEQMESLELLEPDTIEPATLFTTEFLPAASPAAVQ